MIAENLYLIGGINELSSGVAEINTAVHHVNEINSKNRKSIEN